MVKPASIAVIKSDGNINLSPRHFAVKKVIEAYDVRLLLQNLELCAETCHEVIRNIMERQNSRDWHSEKPKDEVSDAGEPDIIKGEGE